MRPTEPWWRFARREVALLASADAAAWDGIEAALTAAGYNVVDEQTSQAPDHDGINRVSATFRQGRWTLVLDAGNDTGGGWVATWQVGES